MNPASLCILAGRYDNPIPTWFLAPTDCLKIPAQSVTTREEVFMEGPLEPNMGPSLADVLLCTFESTNAGFS
jgi:hypothetical protein